MCRLSLLKVSLLKADLLKRVGWTIGLICLTHPMAREWLGNVQRHAKVVEMLPKDGEVRFGINVTDLDCACFLLIDKLLLTIRHNKSMIAPLISHAVHGFMVAKAPLRRGTIAS